MRDCYISELIKEIRGPRYGGNEILTSNPYTEYVTGVLIPKGCKIVERIPDSEQTRPENDDTLHEDEERVDDDTFTVPSELDPQMKPKSFGISFMVDGSTSVLAICVSWARYKQIINDKKSQTKKNSSENKEKNWQRFPHLKILNLKITPLANEDYSVYVGEDGKIFINMRVIPLDGAVKHIIVSLINDLNATECKGDEIAQTAIFQPSIRININGEGTLIPPNSDKKTVLEYLYKDQPVLARGHMCSAIWKSVDFQNHVDPTIIWPESGYCKEAADFISCDVRSEFIPLHPSPGPDFSWSNFGSDVKPEFSARKLSEMWQVEDIEKYLTPIIQAYQMWIYENETALKNGAYENNNISKEIIENQKKGLLRLKAGIYCLKQNEDARLAFCFANRVL